MASRRDFLRSGAMLSSGLVLAPWLSGPDFRKKVIGLQLYTVRDAMAKDPAGTLAKVAAIGYNSLEGATYTGTEKFYGMEPAVFRGLLREHDFIMPSAHYRLGEEQEAGADVKGTILHDWERAVADAHAVGLKYMVCAYLSPAERGNIDHFKRLAEAFNHAGETCRKAGIQLCYHNHDFEFQLVDGKYPYDVLLDNTDKDLVKMEMDIYWVTKAGRRPDDLFHLHPGRFPLWHVKDMSDTAERTFAEVGSGVIDFKTIFTFAKLAGMQYFFVEQDICPGSPFDSITKSYQYIRSNLV